MAKIKELLISYLSADYFVTDGEERVWVNFEDVEDCTFPIAGEGRYSLKNHQTCFDEA
ncbi:hypothetical protein [Pseudoalteromonas sp.]|uniref:hypothetical protein n=1 Tax=Pseudoalteromonas sp. TaxID=53249 RepID=UPI0026203970|nr:hypothetical protein [Pseudoalteromonas sp.]